MPDADVPLLVPIAVQAMMVNNDTMNFIRGSMNYHAVGHYADPSPPPLQAATPARGLYVMWTLPKALRHATQAPGGGFAFKPVPNRWLVVRLWQPAAGSGPPQPPLAACWVVESDYHDPNDGTSPYLLPRSIAAQRTPTMLGRKVAVTRAAPWQEPPTTDPNFLTAVAESNPAFAAYQPFNENVFSIFDDLVGDNVGAASVSYFLLGWYSQPAADPLAGWQSGAAGNDFADALDALNWTASDAGGPAHDTLYHGAAFAVPWIPDAASPPHSPKDDARPQVAVGNTSIDGVTAFARAAFAAASPPLANLTPEQASDLLEAFQYNLLPILDTQTSGVTQDAAEAILKEAVSSQWFGSIQTGRRWVILDAERTPGSPPADPPDADELANEAAWLGQLNAAQADFDQKARTLLGVQRQLFEMWWKQGFAQYRVRMTAGTYPWNTSSGQFADRIADLSKQAGDLITGLNGIIAAGQLPAAIAGVTLDQAIGNFAQAKNLPASRTLKPVADARFWAAVDPVVVISNTAHLLKIDPDAALPCRWPGEVATRVTLGAGGSSFTVDASQAARFEPAIDWTNLPSEAPSLFAEFFLLDPANAGQLAAAAGQSSSAAQTAALAASMSPPQIAAGHGTPPGILAPYPWAQPWQPVYLDWLIEWAAIPFQQDNGTPNWTFNGLDYGLAVGFSQREQVSFCGRCVLTPKPSFDFKSRLEQFIADYPNSPATGQLNAIDNLVESVDQWDFLSQTLGGFLVRTGGRNPVPVANPDTPLPGGGTLADLIGDQVRWPPNPDLIAPPYRGAPIPQSNFEGMRAGQFYIRQLTIVDAFGQTLEVVRDGSPPVSGPQNETFRPLIADGLAPTEPAGAPQPLTVATLEPLRFLQLPPRLVQPGRLNFLFAGEGGNPILGWILPNHLDSGLSAYGPDGTAYGELRLGTDPSGAAIVAWDSAPNSPYPSVLPAPSGGLGEFDNFLSTLQSLGPVAFGDFLQAIDETLWTIDPLGNRTDAFMSVLIGRPLALVAASLSLELQSEVWRDPDWPYTFPDPDKPPAPPPDPLFLGYRFPVRLGDIGDRQDGLIGYFAQGQYASFNSVHVPQTGQGQPAASGFVKAIGPGNYLDLGFAAAGQGPAAPLVLLMDPRAGVHAQCGLLPVKQVSLLPQWVDGAMARIAVTFRTGPALAWQQAVIPPGQDAAVPGLRWPSPAERHGTWSWVERTVQNGWTEMPLAPVDALAAFPDVAPTLRDGLLKLTGGADE